MTLPIQPLSGLSVSLDQLVYATGLEGTEEKPHRFVYFLTIHNNSSETVTIRGRKWVVTEDSGEVLAVEGDGVVGEFPCLEPGEHFSYNSSHVVAVNARAEGAVFGVTEEGQAVFARIPPFELIVPADD